MGARYNGIPPFLARVGREGLGIKVGVETGTYLGESALQLANEFGRCITIELHPGLASRATDRFRNDSRVEVIGGSSRDVLPLVLGSLSEPVMFWLDGHWSGDGTAGNDDICPLESELDALANWPYIKSSMVVIDDARLFGFSSGDDPLKQHFPSILSIGRMLEASGLELFLIDDVLIGFPFDSRAALLAVQVPVPRLRNVQTTLRGLLVPASKIAKRVGLRRTQ